MQSQSGNKIISGIEPVDELMGGLDRGQLYLVHGEASGKSLFGIKFLIEGLKQGTNGALVIRYSPEEAVRRLARLGYDCLEDVYSGRLVILEYSDDIIQKIGKLSELTPVLRELEWLLGETRPERLIFDPVASVLSGAEGNLDSRAHEFAEWARSFGATVVLIANESNQEIIDTFEPLVAESFRFDVRDIGERVARFIAFEKSGISDQAIEVDPSRGVFLLGRVYATEGADRGSVAPHPPSRAELDSIRAELRAARVTDHHEASDHQLDLEPIDSSIHAGIAEGTPNMTPHFLDQPPREMLQTKKLSAVEQREFQAPRVPAAGQPPPSASVEELELQFAEPSADAVPSAPLSGDHLDELSYLLDDLTGSSSPLDLDLPELISPYAAVPDAAVPGPSPAQTDIEDNDQQAPVWSDAVESVDGRETEEPAVGNEAPRTPDRRVRASDVKIDSVVAARAVELLLNSPEDPIDLSFLTGPTSRPRSVREAPKSEFGEGEVRTKDFNILIIEDDSETCDLVTQTLSDYSLEVVHDGVSGLARLISFRPDLVILDFDLPVIDGFKVLALIRSSLNVPIIIVSGSRMRAIDRVMASELGADYYLTKPFSAKELKYKARQLIARYRGLSSWIINPSHPSGASPSRSEAEKAAAAAKFELFTPYSEFAAEVEKRVKTAMSTGAPFSIVGCRLNEMTADGGRRALRLFEIVRELGRDADLISTNPRNDLVILLADAGGSGARAFAGRLRARVMEELNQEPVIWMRSFPDLEESTEPTATSAQPAASGGLNRRSVDKSTHTGDHVNRVSRPTKDNQTSTNPRNSYIDFLDHL